jgi:DNA polymerase III sliding clamp (beta) subunit (PCNA family)
MNGSFTAPAGALVPAVRYAARWLDTRPANPTLGGMVFDVSVGVLTIAAQGELATARATLDVDANADCRFIVSGRLIDTLVATLTDKPIVFEQRGAMVRMSAGRYWSELPLMPESDYPSLASVVPTVGRVEGAGLIDAVRRVGAVASRDTTPGILYTGIYLRFEDDELTLMGTDRNRATLETVEWKADGGPGPVAESFVLPASVLVDAGDAFAGLDVVEVGWNGGTVSLSTPSRSLVTRTLGQPEDFPPVGALFSQIGERTHTATLTVRDLLVPLKRADQLADTEYRHVAIDLRADTLVLRSATEGKGGGGEEIDIQYDGPDCTIMTRSAILHGALATVPGPTVMLHVSPGTFLSVFATSPDNLAWRHLFMPIRHT